VEHVIRDRLPGGEVDPRARFEQPVRDDHPRRQPAHRDRHRVAGQQEAPLRARLLGPDLKRQPAQAHPAERRLTRLLA
jgi:hypothetical protein